MTHLVCVDMRTHMHENAQTITCWQLYSSLIKFEDNFYDVVHSPYLCVVLARLQSHLDEAERLTDDSLAAAGNTATVVTVSCSLIE